MFKNKSKHLRTSACQKDAHSYSEVLCIFVHLHTLCRTKLSHTCSSERTASYCCASAVMKEGGDLRGAFITAIRARETRMYPYASVKPHKKNKKKSMKLS